MKAKLIIWIIVFLSVVGCTSDQSEQMLKNSLSIEWEVIENDEKESVASFKIINTSGQKLTNSNWKVYFTQITGGQVKDFDPEVWR